jgi:chemotaxis protein CheZ
MPKNGTRRLFSAELKMLEMQGKADPGLIELPRQVNGPGNEPVNGSGNGSVSNNDLLNAINALSGKLGGLEPAEIAEGEPIPELDVNFERDLEMAHNLRSELRAMARSIKETKSEIKAMRIGDRGSDALLTASSELDAVVMATEEATNSILNATETIEGLASKLQLNADTDDDRQATEDIMEQTIKMLEACNFQDITGQRITKVVNTLKFVEERIDAMIEIWGEDDIAEVEASVTPDKAGDSALLNGPSLDGEGIDQNDIDKLFD